MNSDGNKEKGSKEYKASFDSFLLNESLPAYVYEHRVMAQAEKAASVMKAIAKGCPESLVVRYEMTQKGLFTVEIILDPDLFESLLEVSV